MLISDLRLERIAGGARALARIAWEDAPRSPFELSFQTDSRAADDLAPEPEAFLTACALAAMRNGERRIRVEGGALCPRLVEGLATAAVLVGSWYGERRGPIPIEASGGFRARLPRRPARSAFFFTGGIDSSHALHINRRDYPRDHPFSLADGLLLHGNIQAESYESPWSVRALGAVGEAADAAGLTLVPIRTNLWELEPDLEFVATASLSSGLAAAAHLFRRRWTRVSISSGRGIAREIPRGTNALLDPLYSSSAIDIRHEPLRLTRVERLAELASGPGNLAHLVVCLAYPGASRLNCGECEKCVRTMTQLLAIGRLEEATSFPHREVRPAMIRSIDIGRPEVLYWDETLPVLAKRGRPDLIAAIEEKLREADGVAKWSADAGWTGGLRRLDRRFLGGRLLSLRRRLSARRPATDREAAP